MPASHPMEGHAQVKSLLSVNSHELDAVLECARSAAKAYCNYGRSEVDYIVRAVADAAGRNARQLAEKAVRETGFGVIEDKAAKNEALSYGFVREYGHFDFATHRVDEGKKLLLNPIPAGVILAVTPSTSPVANLYFKVLSSLLTRNAVVISPHPAAVNTGIEAARILGDAAIQAGAPEGVVQILEKPSVPLVEAAMSDPRVNLILATGGSAVVRAAYRSGTPAIGVGPGNAPVLVDETADLERAADEILASKTFDNSVLCTAESVLIVVESVAARLNELLGRRGAYICNSDETARLRRYMYPGGKFNTEVVGRPAQEIARSAGINVPAEKRLLLAPFTRLHGDEPFTHEKLSPVLATFVVTNFHEALSAAESLIDIVGVGHSAVIHSCDPQRVLDFTYRLPVHRVAVNVGGSLGNAGVGTALAVTMSVGTGFVGGSSLGENLSPDHLVQWKRAAYALDAEFPPFDSLVPNRLASHGRSGLTLALDDGVVREELRRLIVEELRGMIRNG